MIAKQFSGFQRGAVVGLGAVASGIFLWLSAGCAGPAKVSGVDAEAPLIRVLQSSATPAEKDAACVQLKRVGTARCVPALAARCAMSMSQIVFFRVRTHSRKLSE